MEIIFLGTSSGIRSHTRNHPGILLKTRNDCLLFDCGESTQGQLMEARINPMKISNIFITHYHGGHILGLPGLLQLLNLRKREEPLTIYGPKGIKRIKKAIYSLGHSKFNFPIEFKEIDDGTVLETDEYIIKAKKVKHSRINLAYSIEDNNKPVFLREKAINLGVPVGPLFGKLHNGEEVEVDGKIIKPEQVLGPPRKSIKITYSGDTKYCKKMIEFAKDSDLLIHESTYTLKYKNNAKKNSHSTSRDAASVAKSSNSKRLILTHISPFSKPKDLLKEASEVFENVEIAYDLMIIDV